MIPFLCTVILLSLSLVESTELTLELQERDKQCFHELIEKETKFTLDFQVGRQLMDIICMDFKLSLSVLICYRF